MSPYSSIDDVDVLFWKSAVKTSLFLWFGSNPSQFIPWLFSFSNCLRMQNITKNHGIELHPSYVDFWLNIV